MTLSVTTPISGRWQYNGAALTPVWKSFWFPKIINYVSLTCPSLIVFPIHFETLVTQLLTYRYYSDHSDDHN